MKIDCDREPDVLDALAAQRWPARCGDELRTHVAACAVCGDLVQVASALLEDHDTTYQDARLPPSGIVWWRAQLRAREEDARAAARPIAFIQRAVPASTVAAWKEWAIGLAPRVSVPVPDLARAAAAVPVGVFLVIAAVLLLAPLAIYFALVED